MKAFIINILPGLSCLNRAASNIINNQILVGTFVGLMAFATSSAADPQKLDCPTSFQTFDIYAFTETEVEALPTGVDAYATQEEAALDYPDRSLEAFFWSNVVDKAAALEALELADFDGDGLLCMKYVVQDHGHYAREFPDFDPLYLFIFGDKGR
jgi:hypothetical protein